MFITRDSFLHPAATLFCEPGNKGWMAAELTLPQAWFLADFEQLETNEQDGVAFSRTLLFTDFSSIEQMMSDEAQNSLHLKAVHIVTPGHVNGSDTWKMEQLGAVWLGREPQSEHIPMNVFETISGEKYSASFIGLTQDELQIDTMKFNFNDKSRQKRMAEMASD